MKKIIVPTDFSESAFNALKIAADIATKQPGVEIHLVHTYERPVSGITLQFEIDNKKLKETRKHIMNNMDELCNQRFLKNVTVVRHFIIDKEVWEFVEHPQLKDADLIIMGTHGIKNKPRFIGSNTQKVLQISATPVLIIKKTTKQLTVKNMVFASSFGKDTDGVFSKIKAIAELFDSTIHLLRVNTKGDFEKTSTTQAAMETFVKKFRLKNYTFNIYNDETVEDGIVHFNGKISPDLIAMETHDRSRLQALLNPGITRRVVNHTWKPVLSVKIKEKATEAYADINDEVNRRKRPVKLNPNPQPNPVFV